MQRVEETLLLLYMILIYPFLCRKGLSIPKTGLGVVV